MTDTVAVRDSVLWFLQGTGVKIGHGSEVRIEGGQRGPACILVKEVKLLSVIPLIGGRIIGTMAKNDSSIGVHVTGEYWPDLADHSITVYVNISHGPHC